MENNDEIKTRKLDELETSRVRFDLAARGTLSLISAACIVVFAIMFSIHGAPLFAKEGLTGICMGGIWIAVIAVDFGLVRSGIQFLVWKNGRHIGVKPQAGAPASHLLDDILNVFATIIFIGIGIAVLIAGRLGLGSLRTATQIPLSILSITFGLSSAESVLKHIWIRRAGLDDIIHEIPEKSTAANPR